MKRIKILALFSAAAMLLAAAGCSNGTKTTAAPTPAVTTAATAKPTSTAIAFTDMTGKAVTLEAPATKVVALTASDCEILYALGAGSTIVGRGEYCDYPKEVQSVKSLKSGADTNVEEIVALKPQVVIMSSMAQTTEQIAALEKAGIKCIVSNAKDIAGVYTAIGMIGKVTGKDAEAAKLVSDMKKTFDEYMQKVSQKGKSGKKVYFEVSPLQYGLWTAGANTFMDEIATMLGVTNVFSDIKSWGQISEEQVLSRNPDYIFTIQMYKGSGQLPEDEIYSRAGWSNVSAIKNKNVYRVDSDEFSRPGPRLTDAIKALYDILYK